MSPGEWREALGAETTLVSDFRAAAAPLRPDNGNVCAQGSLCASCWCFVQKKKKHGLDDFLVSGSLGPPPSSVVAQVSVLSPAQLHFVFTS